MQLTIDTNNITTEDKALLDYLLSGGAVSSSKPAGKAEVAAAKAATAKPAEPDGPTVDDAVKAASEAVAAGSSAMVKAALTAVGAKKVSTLEASQVAAFLEALDV